MMQKRFDGLLALLVESPCRHRFPSGLHGDTPGFGNSRRYPWRRWWTVAGPVRLDASDGQSACMASGEQFVDVGTHQQRQHHARIILRLDRTAIVEPEKYQSFMSGGSGNA